MPLPTWPLCLSLCAAFAIAFAATWFARWLAPRLGMVDRPDGRRKLHQQDTPLLGGVSIPVACGGAIATAMVTGNAAWLTVPPEPTALFISACLLCVVGVCDDYRPLRARLKFALQFVAVAPFVVVYGPVESVSMCGFVLPLGVAGYGFVAFWVIGCVNAMNLLDGSDGVAGLTSSQALAGMACLAWLAGNATVGWFALVCAAAVAGFVLHNLPPAKIFLGDAGSMTLGMLAGGLSLMIAPAGGDFSIAAPAALLAIPLLDTSLAMLRRKLVGRGIGSPDRKHIHHRMDERGWGAKKILVITGSFNLWLLFAAVIGAVLSADVVPILACLTMFATLLAWDVGGWYEGRLLMARCKTLFHRARTSHGNDAKANVLPFQSGESPSSQPLHDTPRRKAA